jgi:osmotically-inducible protein OsmY
MQILRAILLAVAVVAFSFAQTPAKKIEKKAAPAAAAAQKSSPAKSDAAIESDIKDRLSKSKLSADKFSVSVRNGVATLSGKTNVVQHKGTATRMAKAAGATSVVNNIEVSQAAKDKAAASLKKSKK